uniref:G_PROTEIN_RECEP_F2_4 domain-containing protein n=1 Tax=Elaeophora elaphi TaxID=1147741 RepID=A0A0R3RM63_9BILA
MFGARIEGPYSFHVCKGACANDEDPVKSDNEIQCSGFNHRQGLPQYSQHCQLYQADQLQHGESFFEADDRYSFYWEYCVQCKLIFCLFLSHVITIFYVIRKRKGTKNS